MSNSGLGYTDEFLVEMGQQVEIKLKDFGFDVTITAVTPGPVVTQFEISLAPVTFSYTHLTLPTNI